MMDKDKKQIEQDKEIEKIVAGLKLVYERLLAEKRAKNSEIVVMRNGKIEVIRVE